MVQTKVAVNQETASIQHVRNGSVTAVTHVRNGCAASVPYVSEKYSQSVKRRHSRVALASDSLCPVNSINKPAEAHDENDESDEAE